MGLQLWHLGVAVIGIIIFEVVRRNIGSKSGGTFGSGGQSYSYG